MAMGGNAKPNLPAAATGVYTAPVESGGVAKTHAWNKFYAPGQYPRISGDAGAPAGVPGTGGVADPYGRYGGFGQAGLGLRAALGLGRTGFGGGWGGGMYGGIGGGGYAGGGGMGGYRRAPGFGGGGAGIYGGQGKAPLFNPFLAGF